MASKQWCALREAFTAAAPKAVAATVAAARGLDLRGIEGAYSLAAEPSDVTYEETQVAGMAAIWVTPMRRDDESVLIYFHGGGFISGSKESHRKIAAHLAKAGGVRTLVPDYRLAPDHPFPAQLEDARAVYGWLLEHGYQPGRIAFAGDSAGGHIATAAAIALVQAGIPVPAGIVGFSPWFDLAAEGSTFDTNAEIDIAVSRELAQTTAPMFLGGRDATDPAINLLYADLAGLPPVFLTCGGHETLLDSVERFGAAARGSQVDITVMVADEMPHVYQLMAGRLPEADASIREAGAWLHERLTA